VERTASFAHYTAGGFTAGDQARLQHAVIGAAQRGATVLLSNSSAPLIERLYQTADAVSAGLRIHRVAARRAINSRAAARGAVDELLITNSTREVARVPPAGSCPPAGLSASLVPGLSTRAFRKLPITNFLREILRVDVQRMSYRRSLDPELARDLITTRRTPYT
jgi:hypothetical protein